MHSIEDVHVLYNYDVTVLLGLGLCCCKLCHYPLSLNEFTFSRVNIYTGASPPPLACITVILYTKIVKNLNLYIPLRVLQFVYMHNCPMACSTRGRSVYGHVKHSNEVL